MHRPTCESAATAIRPRPFLVLGLGNILLRDEGVGVRIVQALEKLGLPPWVELFDGATAGLDLLDAIANREKLVVIDALAGRSAPGTVLRLGIEDLVPAPAQPLSLHNVGFLETIAIARHMGLAPREIVIFGVQPADVRAGLGLSPELAEVVPDLIAAVLAEVAVRKQGDAQ